jgi:cold shock protein
MNIKIFIAAIIVSLILSLLAYVIDFSSLFPAPVAYFIIALLSGCFTTFWIVRPSSSAPSKKKSRQAYKPGKPVNKGNKETGSVKWFSASKGFGFITRDTGEDIFVHFRSILGKGHRILQEGQRVEFSVTTGDKGLQAEDVSPTK